MSKGTILQVLPSLHSGGVERGTLDIANALVTEGYRSLVLSSGGPLVNELKARGSTHFQLPVHSKNPWTVWRNHLHINKLVKQESVDLLHVRSRAPAWSVYWSSQHSKTPFITTFHGAYGHQNKLKRWYNSAMLRGCKTIAVSNFIKEHIRATYPHIQTSIKLINRGIDTQLFKPQVHQEALQNLRNTLQIKPESRVILLPGRLTRIKGHIPLLEAVSRLKNDNLKILFVGDEPGKGHYKAEIKSSIKQLNLSNQVHLLGHFSNMPLAYAISDIVVSASTKPEAFGRIACEAQAMEKTVIASAHGGSLETIAPPFRHLMFEANNIDALSMSLKHALAIPTPQRGTAGKAARDYILKNFSLDKMCQDTLQLYALELAKR